MTRAEASEIVNVLRDEAERSFSETGFGAGSAAAYKLGNIQSSIANLLAELPLTKEQCLAACARIMNLQSKQP